MMAIYTPYRRYQSSAARFPYAVRFDGLQTKKRRKGTIQKLNEEDGLLPHGPHNIRDVLATHILKQTGSFEQASYAIQDTPEMVKKHYGRFLPQDKAAIAATVLNKVWSE